VSTAIHKEEPAKPRKPSKAVRFGWGLYQQVAAIFAAFGLAALVGHFWEIGWRGFLNTLVGVWDQTVRPVTTWLCHYALTFPLDWVGIDFVLPQWLQDYLSVGIILALAALRFDRLTGRSFRDSFEFPFGRTRTEENRAYLDNLPRSLPRLPFHIFFISIDALEWPVGILFGWPAAFAATACIVLGVHLIPAFYRGSNRAIRLYGIRMALLTLAPAIYLGLLVAVNQWVL